MEKTFTHAYSRFGVSGTFPTEESCELLSIQSLIGPLVTEVTANELKEKGIITPMDIKSVILNHNNKDFYNKLKEIRKSDGKAAFDFEKKFVHLSEKRLDFISKLVGKCDNNTLVLFHTVEYGQIILNKLKKELPNTEFYYIDGTVSGKNRELIKKEMGSTKKKVEYTILNFGDYEIEFKSDFEILLSNGETKLAKDINKNDDIDDEFIKKYRR